MKKNISLIFLGFFGVIPFLVGGVDQTSLPSPKFSIVDKGVAFPVNFEKFGDFTKRGTNDYKFIIKDRMGLAKAMGTGVFPNVSSVFNDPGFMKWKKKNPKPASHWEHVQTENPQADFYVWATAREVGPGTKLLFTGNALVETGHIQQALKAYYSILVFFPREACWSADQSFVWYVGQEAMNKIQNLTERYPQVGHQLEGAIFKIKNGNDTDLNNDVFQLDPGRWVSYKGGTKVDLSKLKIVNQRGLGKVQLVQFENKQWQLRLEGNPFFVKGVTYSPTPPGQHLGNYGLDWMKEDHDMDGEPDAPYQSWVDLNGNNRKDSNDPVVGDFQLLKDMGANAIRLYRPGRKLEYNPNEFNKKTLRELQSKYGVYVIMGDFLGAYTIGSGASWEEGTDYTDPVQLENMRLALKNYVLDHRREPYVLMWLLGNENLMPSDYSGVNATRTKASQQTRAYLTFVNEMADMIHKLDPDHPVAVGNLGLSSLEEHALYAGNVDIFGANLYLGRDGFGSTWKNVNEMFDRPVMITEFGCDAFDSRTDKENEKAQAEYHQGNWDNIARYQAGQPTLGNSIGGVIFEFIDEWWKSRQGGEQAQEGTKDSPMAFPDGWSSEEWFGVVSRGNGSDPLIRQPRLAYKIYKDKLWKKTN
ncbi:MAG: glycoside hydrolase family 2 TIM barrel-domain containing protein [Elusimicrobiota bacterium]